MEQMFLNDTGPGVTIVHKHTSCIRTDSSTDGIEYENPFGERGADLSFQALKGSECIMRLEGPDSRAVLKRESC